MDSERSAAVTRTILTMKMCPKCNKTTLEPTLDCVVPPEMIRLLQKPIPNGSDARVMPYFCLSCRCRVVPIGCLVPPNEWRYGAPPHHPSFDYRAASACAICRQESERLLMSANSL